MKRLHGYRGALAWSAGVIVLGLIALPFTRGGEARGSSLSRGADGWLAARCYLEARGARVRLLDQPLDRFSGGGVLVETFPWQAGGSSAGTLAGLGEQLEGHLRRGGDLVLAYSGELQGSAEILALEGLGLSLREARRPTLDPLRWRAFSHREWDLRPAGGAGEAIRVWAPRQVPDLPKGASPLFRSPGGRAVIALLQRYRGRILLLPADTFANARLGNGGNADLLETLRRRFGDRWTFDEYHHGLAAAATAAASAAFGRTLDLVLVHLVVLYLAALWTLSRRFGPAWSEPAAATGSAGSFLLGLGALHHRLGHHAEAARRLLARVRELDRDAALHPDLDRLAAGAGPRELVALAREVARRRRPQAAPREAPQPTSPDNLERETAA
jgi:hypothetical protein